MEPDIANLEETARRIRKEALKMIAEAGSGHPGGSLSCADVITALYFYKMKHDPKNPKMDGRDRFILSKGHAAPTLYAALAECGYFSSAELRGLRKFRSILQGHPDSRLIPGVEVSTGSLGQGLSIGCGMALANKMDSKESKVYVLMGDGECDEGQVWEAAMACSHYRLDNIVAIIDRNGLQIDGATELVLSIEPIADKWRSFGWNVVEIDGHNMMGIIRALDDADRVRGKPTMIIAHIIKGKGVSFMEWIAGFHGKAPTEKELEKALNELDGIL